MLFLFLFHDNVQKMAIWNWPGRCFLLLLLLFVFVFLHSSQNLSSILQPYHGELHPESHFMAPSICSSCSYHSCHLASRKEKELKKKEAKKASPVSFKKVIYWFTTLWLDLSHRVMISFKARQGNSLYSRSSYTQLNVEGRLLGR